jgi:hypothetical protein
LWESMKSLREEISRLEQIVTRDDAQWVSVGTSGLCVHYALWEMRETFYLIACNASPEPVNTSFDLQRLVGRKFTEKLRWYGRSAETLADSKLSVRFAPYERQVIELR